MFEGPSILFKGNLSIWQFASAYWRNWGPLMSGVFSVPFVAAAAFQEGYPRAIWAATAVTALVTSSYLVWMKERATTAGLTERLRPKLRLSFDMTDPRCKRPVPSGSPQEDWYRVRVETDSDAEIAGCRGRLISIKRNDVFVLTGETPNLPFALSQDTGDAFNKTIYSAAPECLDLLYITENNIPIVGLYNNKGPTSVDWSNMFSLPGEYVINISVVYNSGSVSTSIHFWWTGKRETAYLWQDRG